MQHHLKFTFLTVLFLLSSELLADASISLAWQKYEQTIVGQSKSETIEPHEWMLGLNWLGESDWMFSLSGGKGRWRGDWNSTTRLDVETRTAGVTLSHFNDVWTQSFGFQFSESALRGDESTSTNTVSETTQSREWFAALTYDALWGSLWLSPTLKLAWQDSELVQASTINFRNGNSISGRRVQHQDGSYADLSLVFSKEFSQDNLLLSPYLLVNWSEVLSGEVVTTSETRATNRRFIGDTEVSDDDSEGSGLTLLGIGMYMENWSFDLSWSNTLNNDTYGRSIALALGYDL